MLANFRNMLAVECNHQTLMDTSLKRGAALWGPCFVGDSEHSLLLYFCVGLQAKV